MANQFLLYDTSVAQWINDTFATLITGKGFNLTVGTPDRAFAEYVTPTGTTPRDGRPPLPRVALTIEDPERDEQRFNSNTIRLLGYADATGNKIRRANYPVPVRLPYTLNFWTEYYREMNLFEQALLQAFRFNYIYLPIDIDSISPAPVYGTKNVGIFSDGGIVNTGDLEPGSRERNYRRTFNFHMKAWLWDFNFQDAYSVKEFEFRYYSDEALTQLLEVSSTPKREVLVAGVNGVDDSFGPVTTARTPIIQNTFLIDATIGGTNFRGRDDGSGTIIDPVDSVVSGTVNYVTGDVSVSFTSPPDAGTDITCAYFTTID